MGTRGPVPSRSDQRHGHRSQAEKDAIETVVVEGKMKIPAPARSWCPGAVAWYRSLKESGQSRFYEPSDWQAAHLCASMMHRCLTGPVNAQLVAQVRAMMSDLLTTEGARRRAGIELERKAAETKDLKAGAASVSRLEDRRKRLTDAS